MDIRAGARHATVHRHKRELSAQVFGKGLLHQYRAVATASRGRARRAQFRPFAGLPFLRGKDKEPEAVQDPQVPSQAHQHVKFDLSLAVELAGASFESYLHPQSDHSFQQRNLAGTAVTFTDKAFLTEAYKGVLVIELQSASNLRPADNNGFSDPFAVVSLGNSSFRTRTVTKSLNPMWNAQFCMCYKDSANDVLRIRLYDEDFGKSDDDLGIAMMSLSVLQDAKGSSKSFTLPLRGNGAGSGATVTLSCRLLSFADADPNDVTAMTTNATSATTGPAIAGLKAAAAAVAGLPQQFQQLQAAAAAVVPGSKPQDPSPTVELPSGEQMVNPWRVLASMVGRVNGASEALSPVAFVENEETDTQVWVYRNVEAREAVLAFRGTEQVKWKDIATDLNLTPCSLNPERLDDNAGLPFTARILKAVSGATQNQMMVHKGFLDAYDSVKRVAISLLDEITGSSEKGAPWRVLVTGHSLGGALATLAAYELAERRTPARAVQTISLYTFGAPRVGNKAFAEEFDRLVPDAWRVTNTNDIIPSVPRLMGYCHIGHAVRLGPEGVTRIGRSSAESTDVFGEGKAGMDVIQELVSKVSEQARPWDEVYSEIAERELKLLDTLVGGKGLEEHMETCYLASLQQAVEAQAALIKREKK